MSDKAKEVLVYAVLASVVYLLAVLPHVLDYGWAWGWPGAGLGFLLKLLGDLVTLGVGLAAVILAVVRPRKPRLHLLLRLVAVPFLLFGPHMVFSSFGGLATSVGRGLSARVRTVTPIDPMQRWAVERLADRTTDVLPAEVAETLPGNPEIQNRGDHLVIRWYDRGVFVGAPSFYPGTTPFFLEQVRPGVWVFVDEK